MMSHFTVAVFSRDGDIHSLLAPYSESLEVAPYIYEPREIVEKEFAEIRQVAEEDSETGERYRSEGVLDMDLKEFVRWYYGADTDEKGNVLTRYNPKSKWDWYQVGGRWQGMLLVRKGRSGEVGKPSFLGKAKEEIQPAPEGYMWVDSAQLKDVEWDMMKELRKERLRAAWDDAQKAYKENLEMGEEEKAAAGKIQLLTGVDVRLGKEEYVEQASSFSTFAVLDEEGEWHERGNMGWWGMVSNEDEDWDGTYWDKFIAGADGELYITIVDCHI